MWTNFFIDLCHQVYPKFSGIFRLIFFVSILPNFLSFFSFHLIPNSSLSLSSPFNFHIISTFTNFILSLEVPFIYLLIIKLAPPPPPPSVPSLPPTFFLHSSSSPGVLFSFYICAWHIHWLWYHQGLIQYDFLEGQKKNLWPIRKFKWFIEFHQRSKIIQVTISYI